ncbi:M48 family metallopeptidase [Helicobacter cholecystus]|uniref:M48 family metallopeptidase n=1 Tax=Helicobacter cholecystus TaxID=45498 RepID=UPI0027385A1C|nr:SprT family zinc-dependent metalloprotease [Helicobacter cholecystus]
MIKEIKGLGALTHVHFTLQQKKIKSIILRVKANNHIHITFPYGVGIEEIVRAVDKRKEWIESKLIDFSCVQKEQYCNGGWIYHLGNIYSIDYIFASRIHVSLYEGKIQVSAKEESAIKPILEKWQKKEAQRIYAEILSYWAERLGVQISCLSIKKMSSRWGSCNPKKGYINLNFVLVKMPRTLIEYVAVHELIHFFFYYHNKDFYAMMNKCLPEWKQRETMLKEWSRKIKI